MFVIFRLADGKPQMLEESEFLQRCILERASRKRIPEDGGGLRTDTVSGFGLRLNALLEMPETHRRFLMTSAPLQNARGQDIRKIVTGLIIDLKIISTNIIEFETDNSHYRVTYFVKAD